jgi:hypothetical protein
MAITFRRAQELGRSNGLNIFIKDRGGSPTNAAEITYNIYDFTTGVEVLMPPSNRIPKNPAIGEYYAAFIIPIDANIGNYRIRWYFRQYVNSNQAQVVQEFAIVNDMTQIITLPGISPIEYDLIKGLRYMLRDANPSKNYKFQPPTGEDSINEFTRVFGYLWEDGELLEFLRVANDSINMYPPQTFYATLDQLISEHRDWRTLLFTGAMVHAITAMALNWTSEEFTFNIGGVSLDIEKSSKYQSLGNDAQERFKEFVVAAKDTVKIIRGLKQSRYGIGIRSSFGPSVGRGSLTPRRFLGL